MRNLFKNKVLEAVLVILGVLFIFQYIIAPGLTAASSITNIITILFSVFIVFGVFKYVTSIKGNPYPPSIDESVTTPGETELDYLPKAKLKATRKTKTTKTK
jgi:hypothetical protein